MKRLGLFGGSFDPVHLGHLLVAQAAHEQLSLDRLCFVPAAQSPFKSSHQPAPASERVRMLRLALAGQVRCDVDEQEIERGGVSYSIDTVTTYLNWYPEAELFYLIGADHVAKLSKWRRSEDLARLVTFVVLARPGEAPPEVESPFVGHPLHGFPVGISSSAVRERVSQGLSIDFLVPSPVADVIHHDRVYYRSKSKDELP